MGYSLFFRGPYSEHNERAFLAQCLRTGDFNSFLDIGANQGLYTLIAARYLQSGQIVAFEPVNEEAQKLERNLRLNRCKNVLVERMAVGAIEGQMDLHVCLDGKAVYSSLRPQSKDVKGRKTILQVQVTTLDAYIEDQHDIQSVDFIKVDVEGGELDVLRGAEQALSNFRPLLMVEVEDRRAQSWGYAAKEIIEFLLRRDYQWFDIVSNGYLAPHSPKHQYRWENLVAVPSERVSTVEDLLTKN
jgi:FkbM family methyltransferase